VLWVVRPPGSGRFFGAGDLGAGDLVVLIYYAYAGSCTGAAAFLARWKKIDVAKLLFFQMFLGIGICAIMSGVCYIVIDQKYVLAANAFGHLHWPLLAPNILSETNVIIRMMTWFCFAMLIHIAFVAALGDLFWTCYFAVGFIMVGLTVVVLVVRKQRALKNAEVLVEQDSKLYGMLWTQLLSEQRDIEALEFVTNDLCKACLDIPSQACSDIDELSQQADRLQLLLDVKLSKWALSSGAEMRTAPRKKDERVVQKIMRSYAGNCGRILDLCRGALIFKTVKELHDGLQLIACDADIDVLRVKNRFHRGYDASLSAGYRDVCLILRLVSDQAVCAGLGGHCFEVQLHIVSLYKAKTDGGHARYIQWRNMRSE